MNKFKNLAKKLIQNKLWVNHITLITLKQSISSTGRPIYQDDEEYENISAVVKEIKIQAPTGVFKFYTEIIVPAIDLADVSLSNKIAIIYNNRRYIAYTSSEVGILNDDPTVISFYIQK